jgi:phosphoserine phosphatase
MDLIQTEVIDELADRAGGGRAITESAMNGEILASFKQRMALLEGLSEDVLVAENLPITQGAHRLKKPQYYGFKTAILSGGFTYGKYLQKELGSITFTLMNWKL